MIISTNLIIFLKQIFSLPLNYQTVNKILKTNIQLKSQLENILSNNPEFETLHKLIVCILNNEFSLPKCKSCNKQLKYSEKHKIYCSKKCTPNPYSLPEIQEKIKQTHIKNLGVSYPAQSKSIIEKRNKTNLLKYNSTSPAGNSKILEKMQQTCLLKYNCKNPMQNENIKQKARSTNKEKYGEEIYTNTLNFKAKKEQTCLEKYNTSYPNPNIEKRNKTNLLKYGQKNIFKTNYFKEKSKQTCLINYNVENFSQSKINLEKSYNNMFRWKQSVIPNFSIQEFNGYHNNQILEWKCLLCNTIFSSTYNGHTKPRCLSCFPIDSGFSQKEKQLTDFCKQYFPNLLENDRSLIKPYELDIVIPQINLAIEFNGLYWHSILQKPSGYHLMKTQKCQQQRYRLIHVWEDELQDALELLKSIFSNNEIIDTSKPLDRCRYSILQFQNYQIISPTLITKNNYQIENCGYLKII